MLRSVKDFESFKLRATDGVIGKVREFYFDDKYWTVRYLVAETGGWLSGRRVLLSPHALHSANEAEHVLPVDLTKKQIEESPSLASDEPVSRQYETQYYGYYGWPTYWTGPYMWGASPYMRGVGNDMGGVGPNMGGGSRNMGGVDTDIGSITPGMGGIGPSMGGIGSSMGGIGRMGDIGSNMGGVREAQRETTRHEQDWDPNLRSTDAVAGHHIQAQDGEIGHVEDFIIDDETWAIRYLVVDTKNWWPGRHVLVSPQWIDRVSWKESKVFVSLSCETIKQSPEYTPESLNRDYETALHRHYDRHGYWTDEQATHEKWAADHTEHQPKQT